MSVCLQAEIKWINANINRYDSPLHAKAVIGNITKRYIIVEMQKEIGRTKMARHEDEYPIPLVDKITALKIATTDIEIQYCSLKRERDDLVALLRRCETVNESEIRGIISDYLIEYDIPF